MATLGERIKEVRTLNKMNQTTFAKELGISQNHVSNLENGNENPSATLIKLICLKFRVDEHWLKNGIGDLILEFDSVTDEGLFSKYSLLQMTFERMIRTRTGEELKLTIETFGYLGSLLSANGISEENRSAYLSTVCESLSLIDIQESATNSLRLCGNLKKGSYQEQLRYKTLSEKRLKKINELIREMNNIYLKQLGASTEL